MIKRGHSLRVVIQVFHQFVIRHANKQCNGFKLTITSDFVVGLHLLRGHHKYYEVDKSTRKRYPEVLPTCHSFHVLLVPHRLAAS